MTADAGNYELSVRLVEKGKNARMIWTLQDELAEQTLKAISRKFSSSAKIWMRQIAWLLSKGQSDAVKRTLDKAFKALPQRKHIKVRPAGTSRCLAVKISYLPRRLL